MHAASPFFYESADVQKELIEPAVHGTRNVLSAVAKNKSTVKATVVRLFPGACFSMLLAKGVK